MKMFDRNESIEENVESIKWIVDDDETFVDENEVEITSFHMTNGTDFELVEFWRRISSKFGSQ